MPMVLLLGCTPNQADEVIPTAAAEGSPDVGSAIELRIEPFPELYFAVRAQAAGVAAPLDLLDVSARAWEPVQAEIGSFGGFWRFDLAGLLSSDPSGFLEWVAEYPETIPSRGGGSIPMLGPGIAMHAGMQAAWAPFLSEEWPQRQEALEAARQRLEQSFMPKHREALSHMMHSLGIDDPGLTVPIYLVTHTQPPGATTYRSRGGPVVVVSAESLLLNERFSDLEETLLHETCHTLDAASDKETDAFSVLRRLLAERGISESDGRFHDVPHLLMFAQAEQTMRRIFDREHVAYGDSARGNIAPLYERSGQAAIDVRRHWSDYLDGRIDRDTALAQISRDVAVSN